MEFKAIDISNFRGIGNLNIPVLKQFNLLMGENNCGKTTVLEALFLLSGMSNPQLPVTINNMRGFLMSGDQEFESLFHNRNYSKPIVIQGAVDDIPRELRVTTFSNSPLQQVAEKGTWLDDSRVSEFDQSGIHGYSTNESTISGILLSFKERERISSIKVTLTEVPEVAEIEFQEYLKCTFIPSNGLGWDEKRMEKMLFSKNLPTIIGNLQAIQPDISDVRMGAKGMVFIDVGNRTYIPANFVGDGIRRILGMLSSIVSLKGGILLVDEIDRGLHYSSMKIMWKAVYTACQFFNVQLVATTHSLECIDAFVSAAVELGDDFRPAAQAIRIDRKGQDHKTVSYDIEELRASFDSNFEVR